jgi:uncharacterized protein (UPF0332 family)
MNFDWNSYLTLAKRLAADTDDDDALRSAVSRSYYCIFNLAMLKARANQYITKDDASSHDQLWSLYGRNVDEYCEQVSLIGARMKRRRVKADYRSFFDNLKEEVEDAIEDAEKCIELLGRMAKDLPKDVPRSWSF